MSDSKPTAPRVADLRQLPALEHLTRPENRRWVLWKYEWITKSNREGKWTKVPYQLDGEHKAANNRPAEWSNYDLIWKRYCAGDEFDGIGLMLLGLGGLAAIDLDDVRDPVSGYVLPWAEEIAEGGSYCEVTPSLEGLRALGDWSGDKVHRNGPHPDGGKFELFANCERYITFTGLANGSADRWGDISACFNGLLELLPKQTPATEVPAGVQAPAIDIETLSLFAAELITRGTIDGAEVEHRGPAFAKVARELYGRGHGFEAALALLARYPAGVQAKYGGRLRKELSRIWGKLEQAIIEPVDGEIRVAAGLRHEAADAGLAAMTLTRVPFYQRDKKLVTVEKIKAKAMTGETMFVPGVAVVGLPTLTRALGKSAVWKRFDGRVKDWLRCDPPDAVAAQILAMVGEWPFPPFRGVIGTQTMRPDGSLLTEPGYDERTGYVLFNPPEMRPIPENPSKDGALAALQLVDGLFDEFPFADDGGASRSVALSLFTSTVLRTAMPVVPLHVIHAPEGGTGKSYIGDVIAVGALGEKCAVIARGKTDEETEKRLIGAAAEGQMLIVIDNVNGEIRSEFLCQAIERPLIKPRPLGTSVMPAIPNSFVCVINGINVEIGDDLIRRTIRCGMDANMENPYLRNFTRDPVAEILADRGKYVAAVLTMARAYVQHGRPKRPTQLASFKEWSDLVRGMLIWLGRPDPVETMLNLAARDPTRQGRAYAFTELKRTMDPSFTAADAIRASRTDGALREALLDVAKSAKDDEGAVNPKSLGWWLKRNADRIAGGHKLIRNDDGKWSIVTPEAVGTP